MNPSLTLTLLLAIGLLAHVGLRLWPNAPGAPQQHLLGQPEALRETLAALFLRQCGFTGSEPVVDPMCGSGTIAIEAALLGMA